MHRTLLMKHALQRHAPVDIQTVALTSGGSVAVTEVTSINNRLWRADTVYHYKETSPEVHEIIQDAPTISGCAWRAGRVNVRGGLPVEHFIEVLDHYGPAARVLSLQAYGWGLPGGEATIVIALYADGEERDEIHEFKRHNNRYIRGAVRVWK